MHVAPVSKKAMEWTDQNVSLNPSETPHTSMTGNVLEYLKNSDTYTSDLTWESGEE